MKEIVFQRELADAFRGQGWWVRKWPDAPVRAMQAAGSGKLRFALPKPCDLILFSAAGRGGLVECKLARSGTFRLDARTVRQVQELSGVSETYQVATWLAINFRYLAKRPVEKRVNRAFLIPCFIAQAWAEGDALTPEMLGRAWELARVPRGWALQESLAGHAGARPEPQEKE